MYAFLKLLELIIKIIYTIYIYSLYLKKEKVYKDIMTHYEGVPLER